MDFFTIIFHIEHNILFEHKYLKDKNISLL